LATAGIPLGVHIPLVENSCAKDHQSLRLLVYKFRRAPQSICAQGPTFCKGASFNHHARRSPLAQHLHLTANDSSKRMKMLRLQLNQQATRQRHLATLEAHFSFLPTTGNRGVSLIWNLGVKGSGFKSEGVVSPKSSTDSGT